LSFFAWDECAGHESLRTTFYSPFIGEPRQRSCTPTARAAPITFFCFGFFILFFFFDGNPRQKTRNRKKERGGRKIGGEKKRQERRRITRRSACQGNRALQWTWKEGHASSGRMFLCCGLGSPARDVVQPCNHIVFANRTVSAGRVVLPFMRERNSQKEIYRAVRSER